MYCPKELLCETNASAWDALLSIILVAVQDQQMVNIINDMGYLSTYGNTFGTEYMENVTANFVGNTNPHKFSLSWKFAYLIKIEKSMWCKAVLLQLCFITWFV